MAGTERLEVAGGARRAAGALGDAGAWEVRGDGAAEVRSRSRSGLTARHRRAARDGGAALVGRAAAGIVGGAMQRGMAAAADDALLVGLLLDQHFGPDDGAPDAAPSEAAPSSGRLALELAVTKVGVVRVEIVAARDQARGEAQNGTSRHAGGQNEEPWQRGVAQLLLSPRARRRAV